MRFVLETPIEYLPVKQGFEGARILFQPSYWFYDG